MAAESIPYLGIAAIARGPTWEVYDACETICRLQQ
jgi:hypothetical protein